MQPNANETEVHSFNVVGEDFKLTRKVLAIFLGAAVLGIISGFFLFKFSPSTLIAKQTTATTALSGKIEKGTVIGSDDTKTFKDTAEGVLKEGGIDGEGAFHLVRPGGEAQNVYLTSSTVDLSSLVDRKIKVWGETQKAQVAGWLMDVGRVEVLE